MVAPTPVIFVCGGQTDVKSAKPLSLRDALLKVAHRPALAKYKIILAEDVNIFIPEGKYKDFLRMEADLAEISELVVLFSESYGSAVELGAFALTDEIAARLLVVVDDKNYNEDSFVKYGPLLFLENVYGPPSVFVLDHVALGFDRVENLSGLKLDAFATNIEAAFDVRLKTLQQPTSFNDQRNGHLIKLSTGLIQHFGALTGVEVQGELSRVGVNKTISEVEEYLKCAEVVRWIKSFRSGFTTYYVAIAERNAISYRFKKGIAPVDRMRWHADILLFWSKHDNQRHGTILSVRGGRS